MRTPRIAQWAVGAVTLVAAGSLATQWRSAPSSISAAVPPEVSSRLQRLARGDLDRPGSPPPRLSGAEGVVFGTVGVYENVPAVTKLDAVLLDAVRRAADDAADQRVTITLTSGWRAATYQQELLDRAVAEYGSREAAARWVAPPTKSAHVVGDAVDASARATPWLQRHGAKYGLCQIYDNEPWHFELRRSAPRTGCPRRFADAAHDPRMR